jgi:predicted nuclease of predicted toxin-antitoxin system
MQVLLDECLPRRLKRELPGHMVKTVPEMGWAGTKNGALLRLIQTSPIDVLITVDGNMEHQQNLRSIRFAIIVLRAADIKFETLCPLMPAVQKNLQTIKPTEIIHIGD